MATAKKPAETKARVLCAGHFGKPDDVVVIPAEELELALASGQVDIDPEAVAYAESLIAQG